MNRKENSIAYCTGKTFSILGKMKLCFCYIYRYRKKKMKKSAKKVKIFLEVRKKCYICTRNKNETQTKLNQ